jgi:hypothetical protein
MVAKIQTAFRHFIGSSMARLIKDFGEALTSEVRLFTAVRGISILDFGFIAFSEYWMQILHRSPRERREVDFRSCASKR